MKILLVNPPYVHSNAFDSRAPSLALFYLAAELQQRGHQVEIYDATIGPVVKTDTVYRYGQDQAAMATFLQTADFDLAGITCSYTARWRFVDQIARVIKEFHPTVPVAVGGLFPTSEWEYCLRQCPAVDIVFLGEAEQTLGELADRLGKGQALSQAGALLDGVAWREGENFFSRPKERYIEKLDELPFPAWHLVNLADYFAMQRRIFELPPPCLPVLP